MPPGTTLRNVRIPDDLWDAALRKAEEEQTSVSDVIREFLQRWVS
jgi:predicted CopG family antitoxin